MIVEPEYDYADMAEAHTAANECRCPICDVPFKPNDLCATEITEGVCHAACLEDSDIVDLDSGEPAPHRPIRTYRFMAA